MALKVLILGASGIVGQHLRLCAPEGIQPIWVRRETDMLHEGCDLEVDYKREDLLAKHRPDVVLNLAGESRVDVVEADHAWYFALNVVLPCKLALWCIRHGARMLQVSSQAVWSGENAPYAARLSDEQPVNHYGQQKKDAEDQVYRITQRWQPSACIARLTFILGYRPLPHVGRPNPLEVMAPGSKQVCDRWFSPLMAMDAARALWQEIVSPSAGPVVQFGVPAGWTRSLLATVLDADPEPVTSDAFPAIAPRPIDTTYAPVH